MLPIKDKHALPIPEGDSHISELWFASDGLIRTAKLKGCIEGAERQKLWDEQMSVFETLPEETI